MGQAARRPSRRVETLRIAMRLMPLPLLFLRGGRSRTAVTGNDPGLRRMLCGSCGFPFLRKPTAFLQACIDLALPDRWAHRENSPIAGQMLKWLAEEKSSFARRRTSGEVVADCKNCRGGARFDADFLHRVLDVVAGRSLADRQRRSDRPVAQSLSQQAKNLDFT